MQGHNDEPAKKGEQDKSEMPRNKTIPLSSRGARMREEFLSKIVPWEKITVSLDNFPYYIE